MIPLSKSLIAVSLLSFDGISLLQSNTYRPTNQTTESMGKQSFDFYTVSIMAGIFHVCTSLSYPTNVFGTP